MKDSEKEKVKKAKKMLGLKIRYRKVRDMDIGDKAVLFFCIAFILIIFCIGTNLIQKVQVVATVVIAFVALLFQYNSYKEKKSKGRESSIIKICGRIVSVIQSEHIGYKGNIHLNFFGERGKIAESISKRYVKIDCQYVYDRFDQKSVLAVTVLVLKDKEGKKYDDHSHRIMYYTTPTTCLLTNQRCYFGSLKDPEKTVVIVPAEVSSFSDREWDEMIRTLYDILESLIIDGVKKVIEDHKNLSFGT